MFTRPWAFSETSFARHWARLELRYGRVQGFSLLGLRGPERDLSAAYRHHVAATSAPTLLSTACSVAESRPTQGQFWRDFLGLSSAGLLDIEPQLTQWDIDMIEARMDENPDLLRNELQRHAIISARTQQFGFTVIDADSHVRVYQQGVVRTNCLNCLERTNLVQGYLSQFALFSYLVRASSAANGSSTGKTMRLYRMLRHLILCLLPSLDFGFKMVRLSIRFCPNRLLPLRHLRPLRALRQLLRQVAMLVNHLGVVSSVLLSNPSRVTFRHFRMEGVNRLVNVGRMYCLVSHRVNTSCVDRNNMISMV